MADRASDWILEIDRATAGGVKRRLVYAQHVEIPTSAWGDMRTAAGTSLSALDSWFSTYSGGAWNAWWSSWSATEREGARQALLLGS
jgi:hypothetical protein